MQFQSLRTCCVAALLYLVQVSCILGQTTLLAPSADTSLFEFAPDNNLGGLNDLPAGATDNGAVARILLKFDLAQVPPGATVTQATLFVTVVRTPLLAEDSTFALHRVLRDWGEGSKGGLTSGSMASADEATWNARFHPTNLWAMPGGKAGVDFAADPSAEVFVAGLDTYEFVSSAPLVADVQSWLDNPGSNFGWMLKTESEGVNATARRFASGENPFGDAPLLIVQYTVAPRIQRVELTGNQFCLYFQGKAGKGYTIERRSAVEAGTWAVVMTIPPVAADGELSVCDPLTSGNRFYRLREQ